MWEPEHSVILPLRSVVHRSNVTLAVSVGTPRFALLCGAVQRHWRPWRGFRPPCAIRVSGQQAWTWLRLKHAGWMGKQCKVESLSDMEEARRDVRIMTHEEEREESWEKGKAVF